MLRPSRTPLKVITKNPVNSFYFTLRRKDYQAAGLSGRTGTYASKYADISRF